MFKVGNKIVCVKPSISLVKNEIYTIKFIKEDGGLMLEEVTPKTFNCNGFKPERFRKVDYDFADSVQIENILLRFKVGQKPLDESTKAICDLFSVSQQRELLKKWWRYFDEESVAVNCNDEEREEVITNFFNCG